MKTIKNLTAEQIRKSILQLAIQGKLVKQDPNDEPASELVKRIYEEKQRLIKEGKLKKDKNESYIYKGDNNCYYEKVGKEVKNINDEIPFEIPDSWVWARFPSIVDFKLGKTPERHNQDYWNDAKYPWVSIADMKEKETIYETKERISENALNKCFKSTLSSSGTLIMSFKLTVGRVSILGMDAVHNEAIISIIPIYDKDNSIKNWLFNILGIITNLADQTDAIKGSTLNKDKLSSLLIPIPSIGEQQRIISKLYSFESLLKEYEEKEKQLTNLESSFESRLKASILQYAIEGKLVKQDPNDEPASVLLERIKAEKEKLIKEGKIKRDKNESEIVIGDDKNYYENNKNITKALPIKEIPNSWRWIRLDTLFAHNTGKALNSKNTTGTNLEYITTSNLYWNNFILNDLKKMYFLPSELQKCTVKKGDLLVCEGGDIGRAAIWNLDKTICIQNHIHRLRPYIFIPVEFYLLVLRLYKFTGYIGGKGIGIQGLSTNALGKLFLPLPPIEEQKRISKQVFAILKDYKIAL